MSLEEENKMLKDQIKQLASMIGLIAPKVTTGLVSQRKARRIFGVTWLQEKNADAAKNGVRLWVRTGAAANSPKKYELERLCSILEWERTNGLPYNFKKDKR